MSPYIHMPGFGLPPSGTCGAWPQMVDMSNAACSFLRAASRNASETFIGYATPISAMRSTRAGWRAAHSSAIRAPSECPTSAALPRPALSSTRTTQSAIASTDASGGPSLRPCPGRSSARTLRP